MAASHKYQAPTGTRDFYPADLAVRRHMESIWREVSTNHGFEEIDGPTFEHLELYTAKSGPGIVSELFSFRRSGGDTDYALRPEFTPTLARMVAARAAQLPKPIKWFCMPNFFRAERPQRGRLREFQQWNVDFLGAEGAGADADVIATAIEFMTRVGLSPNDIRVKIGNRTVVEQLFRSNEIVLTDRPAGTGDPHDDVAPILQVLDRRDKLTPEEFVKTLEGIGLLKYQIERLNELLGTMGPVRSSDDWLESVRPLARHHGGALGHIGDLQDQLRSRGIIDWCELNLTDVVRGLAYYTGTVFEVHEASGQERAIAGGGRYDKLVELFGGPPTPAVGFAMGDVVVRLVLEDRGLLKPAEAYLPRPDVFIIAAKEGYDPVLHSLVAQCRHSGLHARHSYKATRNVGKLLGEAGKARARLAVIIGDEYEQGRLVVKDLESGQQESMPFDPNDAARFVEAIRAKL